MSQPVCKPEILSWWSAVPRLAFVGIWLGLFLVPLTASSEPPVASPARPGSAAVERTLADAGTNRAELVKLVNVRYSTQRRRADAGPLETMESGLATCTGLSILLVDACRAVGVPARVIGTPLRFNNRGNHTWVEIWDGDWHFAGAAEPDAKGLDRAWFKHDASQALKDVPEHAIYASSFAKTGLAFPLVWAPDVQYVSAVNVTDRCTPNAQPGETNKVRLLVACYAPPPVAKALKPADEAKLKTALTGFFTAPTNRQGTWKFSGGLEKLLRNNEPAVRRAAWEACQAAPLHAAARQDFDARQVRFEKHLSPYTVKTVGCRPTNGWALFIAMHGGGGAPKELNDSQWKQMQIYYRDHPEAGGYLYVALRAPNDTWNGFYDTYVYPVAVQIIAGNGHGGLPDRDKIVDMYPAVRHPVPRELTWLMTDKVIRDFFWLRCDAPGKQREIQAVCRDNRLTVTTTTNVTSASVLLDRRLVDFDKPVALELNGQPVKPRKLQPSLRVLGETLLRRGDPELAFTAQFDLPLGSRDGKK